MAETGGVDLQEAEDRLYRLAPGDFTAGRDQLASEARKAGDRTLADQIKKLRRPTMSAWLANLLVRERPRQMEELLDLGAAMREAQDELAGEELRHLGAERRHALAALANEARALAGAAGQPVSQSVAEELEETLAAALADEEKADALRRGTLAGALRYTGTGLDAKGSGAKPQKAGRARPKSGAGAAQLKHEPSGRRELEHAERDAAAARAEAEAASGRAKTEERDLERLRSRIADAEQTLDELRRQEKEAARSASQSRKQESATALAQERAERNLERVRQALE